MTAARRLAAIMFTDTVGSTASAQLDEAGALRNLQEQGRLFRPILAEFGGREIKSTGDGFLVEFESALKAVQCAVELQRRLHERDTEPGVQPTRVRIGIHLGDVEQRDGDIFGDAVNIAARMEPIADPGGVCVSAQVHDQVRNKLPFQLERLGARSLKGLQEPMEVFRVRLPWLAPETETSAASGSRVAILPFTNMSPDATDQYFADGLTEELIATVSKIHDLSVISRTSVMQYKNQAKRVAEIGRELGVTRVLEGSVRKAGKRIRVTVQLIDTAGDKHLWAETYDRELDDIFAVQSAIAEKVAGELGLRLVKSERESLEKKPTQSSEAYTLYLRGLQLFQERSEDSIRQARQCFERALEIDPRFARAYVALADCHLYLANRGLEPEHEAAAKARSALAHATDLDPDLPELHAALSHLHFNEDNGPAAEAEARQAIELNPSSAGPSHILAELAGVRGETDQMLKFRETASRLDPVNPTNVGSLGEALLFSGREADALEYWRKMEVLFPRQVAEHRAEYYLSKGDLAGAKEHLSLREHLPSPERLWTTWVRGSIAALEGLRPQALAAIRELETSGFGPIRYNLVAIIHLLLGDVDSYFANMERALDAHSMFPLAVMYHPLTAKAREDPRYPLLVERLRQLIGFAAH